MIQMKNILVGTDFSEPSESAVNYGRALARTFGATLHVAHVVENPIIWAGLEGPFINTVAIADEVEQAARKRLGALPGVEEIVTKVVILHGASPAFALADYAKSENIDLAVVGTHGQGAVARLLIGSVAERLVRIAPCPVLTIRSKEHEFVLPDALTVPVRTQP